MHGTFFYGNIIKFIRFLQNIYKVKYILNISRGYKMNKEYTHEQIKDLYFETSSDLYMEEENKEWLCDEKKEEFENAFLTLCKIRRELKFKELDCKMNQRIRFLANIHSLYERMCEDIREDLKQ